MIEMHQTMLSKSRTGRGSKWRARTNIDGQVYVADSRHGAPNELARTLVAAGIPDQAVQITCDDLLGHMSYPSLHDMAKWTYEEKKHSLRRVKWRPAPDRAVFGGGKGQNGGKTPSDVSE